MAFLVHIRPNLSQSYDDDDTALYLINLMPKSLKEGGRRIKNELKQEGKYHDFMYVIKKCRELVQEEQKTVASTPSFVITEDDAMHGLHELANSTGMFLALPGSMHRGQPGDTGMEYARRTAVAGRSAISLRDGTAAP